MSDNLAQLLINAEAVASGILFWAGFLVFGFIARRYSVVFKRATFHTLLMTAPSGILLYALLMMIKSSPVIKDASTNMIIQDSAYGVLLISAVFCLAGIIKFNSLIDELLKYKEQK
ncbi:MAG: hypothetical protein ABSA34_04890 [Candidatus Goldiibacteriota bacterium]|jgi:hypothetical protein